MFDDDSPAPALPPRPERSKETSRSLKDSIKLLNNRELVDLREEINRHLPGVGIKDLDMDRELVTQLTVMRELQVEVLSDELIPANQKAQVGNSVTTIIDKLLSMQVELYNAEQFKKLEQVLIRVLSEYDEEISEKFLTQYRKALEK